MDSKTFYLKYRPQKISELDLSNVREELLKIAKSRRFPHALLFAGPKGTGKTSAARVFAKLINCEIFHPRRGILPTGSGLTYEPCNKCENCREISEGTSLDLIEIDAASNRGIDDIRNLREKIKLSPVKCKYKVYIIDEVHMLTTEAFNALLKTLEEPPAHAIFILCTTAPEKLPPTIISRCLRFNFRKAKKEELIVALKRAVEGEGLMVEKGVLEAIAQAADGSFRDAHKILEQLVLGGKKISLKQTETVLGQTEEFSPKRLLRLLAKKDVKGGLKEIERIVEAGGDLILYNTQILDCLRTAMLAKIGVEKEGIEEIQSLDIGQLKNLINLFSRVFGEIKFAPLPQLPLELTVVEWGGLEMTNDKWQEANEKEQTKKNNPTALKQIEEKWEKILAEIKPLNHSVEALLRSARPWKIDGDVLILEVFYKFHKERLETEKCRSIVEEVISQFLGNPIKLKCILGEKKNFPKKTDSKTDSESNILMVANEIFNGKIIN